MSGEIARRASAAAASWQYGRDVEAVPLTRALARRLGQVQGEAILARAQIEAEEQNMAYKADRRMDNTSVLASHLVDRAESLSHQVTSATKGNPGLEMILRGVEEDVALGGRALIRGYMTRRI